MGKTLFTFTSKADWQSGIVPPQIDLDSEPGKVKLYRPTTLFSRASVAYLPDGAQVLSGNPRYVAGKFGRAIMIEEGVTNALKLDSEGIAVGGAAQAWGSDTAGVTRTVSSDYALFGAKSMKWSKPDKTGTGNVYYNGPANIDQTVTGVTWTFSCYVRRSDGVAVTAAMLGTAYIYINGETGTSAGATTNVITVDLNPINGWYRVRASRTGTLGAGPLTLVGFTTIAGTVDWYFDGWQAEIKGYATSFANGTRNTEMLPLLTTGLSPTAGSVEFWWTPTQATSGIVNQVTSPGIFQMGDYFNNGSFRLWAWYNSPTGGEPVLRLYVKGAINAGWSIGGVAIRASGSGWYVVGQPIKFCVSWTGGDTFFVNVNGVEFGPYTISDPITAWAGNTMWLGAVSGNSQPNGYYDDFRASTIKRTAAESLIAYNTNAPLTTDVNTLGLFSFDDSLLSEYPPSATLTTKAFDLGGMHEMPLRLDMPTSGGLIQITHYQSSPDGVNGWGPWLDMQGDKTGPYVGPWIRFKIVLYAAP